VITGINNLNNLIGVKPNVSGSGSSTNLIFVILLILAIGAGIFMFTR